MVPGIPCDNYMAKLSIQPCPKEVHEFMLLSDQRKLRREIEGKCLHYLFGIFSKPNIFLYTEGPSKKSQPAKGICIKIEPFSFFPRFFVGCALHLFLFHF
jgi:hypothetical protein